MLFKHFWILCGLWVGVGTFAYGKFKADSLIEQGSFTKAEVNRHLFTFMFCILVPCILFWVIQQTGTDIENPFFTEWPNPQRLFAIVLLWVCWFSLGTWVFFLKGAIPLAKTMALISNVPESFQNPSVVKVFVALILATGVVSLTLQSI